MPRTSATSERELITLLQEISHCKTCAGLIPEPRPVLRAAHSARILIVGQAPGTKVHASGIPWDDASGRRLRSWLNVDADTFYDPKRFAIIPMGFCYPGKGKSGDLPPRSECAAQWHGKLLDLLPNIECTLLIGRYAQQHYLDHSYPTLTECVQNWRLFAPTQFVLPHPSPRNQLWLKRNVWFEEETVPAIQDHIARILRR